MGHSLCPFHMGLCLNLNPPVGPERLSGESLEDYTNDGPFVYFWMLGPWGFSRRSHLFSFPVETRTGGVSELAEVGQGRDGPRPRLVGPRWALFHTVAQDAPGMKWAQMTSHFS